MPTKTRPSEHTKIVRTRKWGTESNYTNYFEYYTGSETITYDDGAKFEGKWPWKACEHVTDRLYSPVCASIEWGYQDPPGWYGRTWRSYDTFQASWDGSMLPVPTAEWDPNTIYSILSQLDLNSKENVLLYSGVLQAVPLLGAVTKFNSIMKGVSKYVTKSLRKKPFTTVLQSLISADFIDRFVISPTLDDVRRFQDSTDYVLRVIETARQRSSTKFALSSEVKTDVDSWEGTFRATNGDAGAVYGTERRHSSVRSKAFMLLEAKYDMLALDPIKIWAQRVGLTRPLDSVWDLVPFSFVIDYFTRAGDFIAALSDEMSNVEGLHGTITKIHDLWCTVDARSEIQWEATSNSGDPNTDRWWAANRYYHWTMGESFVRSGIFRRFRIPNPWPYLLSLNENLGDYLTVNTQLSSTRKRTLLELFIQSKLRRH